jgi:hypothetical protein
MLACTNHVFIHLSPIVVVWELPIMSTITINTSFSSQHHQSQYATYITQQGGEVLQFVYVRNLYDEFDDTQYSSKHTGL